MAERSKAWGRGRSLGGITVSNPAGVMFGGSVLSGIDLCGRPITLPDESYRVWCVCV